MADRVKALGGACPAFLAVPRTLTPFQTMALAIVAEQLAMANLQTHSLALEDVIAEIHDGERAADIALSHGKLGEVRERLIAIARQALTGIAMLETPSLEGRKGRGKIPTGIAK